MTRRQTRMTRARVWTLAITSGVAMALVAALMLLVGVVTAFLARRLYAGIATLFARGVVRLWGVRTMVHREGTWPRTQTVYISNHPSTLDIFLIVALGLPRTRYFLSGFLQKFLPLGVIARMMGTFFTVPQSQPDERRRIFAAAAETLRATGESVYLSPEGGRVTGGRIGPFNKGAFHLAASLGAPIVPLLFVIPPETDPGMGYDVRPGTVHVHAGLPIDTRGWRIDDIGAHRDAVHAAFAGWQLDILETHRAHDAQRALATNAAGAR